MFSPHHQGRASPTNPLLLRRQLVALTRSHPSARAHSGRLPAPRNVSQGVDVTKPNDFDEFRQDQERQVRRWRMATGVIDVLTVLALLAIGALVLRIIFR
jgi:hypothetical protein